MNITPADQIWLLSCGIKEKAGPIPGTEHDAPVVPTPAVATAAAPAPAAPRSPAKPLNMAKQKLDVPNLLKFLKDAPTSVPLSSLETVFGKEVTVALGDLCSKQVVRVWKKETDAEPKFYLHPNSKENVLKYLQSKGL